MNHQQPLQARGPERIVGQMIRWAAALVFSGVIILLLTCSHVSYVTKAGYAVRNVSKLLVAALVAAGIVLYAIHCPVKRAALGMHQKMKYVSCGLLLVQIYLLLNIFFITGWDPNAVFYIADSLPNEQPAEWVIDYLSRYPNNLLLVFIEKYVLKLNDLCGLFPEAYRSMSMGIVNCVILNYVCYQTYKLLYKYTCSMRLAMLGYVLCVLLAGISPWMVIGYSDSLGILFPTLILQLYSTDTKNQKWLFYMKWCAIALVAAMGYFIKPQCIIIFIAIGIVSFFHRERHHLLRIAGLILAFIIFLCSISSLLTTLEEKNGICPKPEMQFGWQHFLMMGLNYEQNGVYSDEDVQFSISIPTAEERNAQNLAVAKERVSELNWRLLKHWAKKLLCLFNDGMFAWGMEGTFYYQLFDAPNQLAAPFLRSLFYTNGSRYTTYASIIHTVWLGVLLLVLIGCILDKKVTKQTSIIRLALLGLVMFELLFEVRARYLFTYVPFFIVLAVQGLQSVKTRLEAMMPAKRKNALTMTCCPEKTNQSE